MNRTCYLNPDSLTEGGTKIGGRSTRDEAGKVLDECPDTVWRLIFALSRYGGLRCPSEHLNLRWVDVDWARNKINVQSPKTEHHAGGESRMIPLFPELRPYLEEAFELAEPGTEYVINRYRDTNANLRTQMIRIIKRAGLDPWPKLFQNLRSTRETELTDTYPIHVVCAWIGNSQPVAVKHYLQVTDEHFEKAVQNPVQQPAVVPRTVSQSDYDAKKETAVLQGCASECDYLHDSQVTRPGLEPGIAGPKPAVLPITPPGTGAPPGLLWDRLVLVQGGEPKFIRSQKV